MTTNIPLRWLLTVPFALPTIAAVMLVGYLSYRSGQEAVKTLTQQLVTETNQRVTQELRTYLHTPLLINRLNVDAVQQAQLDPQNIPLLESALLNRLEQFEQMSAILFASPEGTFRAVERLPFRRLVVADPNRPNQIRVYPLDQYGKRGQLVEVVNNADVRRDRPWYKRAVTTGKLGWNPLFQHGSTNVLTLNASQPVYDRNTRQLLGVFSVHIRLSYLNEFLRHLELSSFGRVMITDQQGILISTSTLEQPFSIASGTGFHKQFQRLTLEASQDDLTRSLGQYLRDRPDALASLTPTQQLKFTHNGEPYYVTVVPFQDAYGLNWRVLTVIPASHFMAAIRQNTYKTLLLCLLTLGVAIMLGWLAANRLTTRFTQFNRVSREVAAGNLDQRLPTDSPIFELNRLADNFNRMADQVQQSFQHIQLALETSEEKFATIFRTSPDPMAIAHFTTGQIQEVNDSLVELFGYSRPEMSGRTALELNLWVDLEQRSQYRSLLQQHKTVRNLEVQFRTKSDAVKTVLLSAEVRTLAGEDCVIVVVQDISDRKATELALQQSEARYRAIVEDQTELIARFLPDTTVVFANVAYCRYFGVTQGDILGKSFTPVIYEADRNRVEQLVQAMNVHNPVVIIENRVIANGEIRWTQWVNRTLFDNQGRVTEIQAVGRDISDLKRTEEALRQSDTLFRQLAETVREGFFIFETSTSQYSYLNPACISISGIPIPPSQADQDCYRGMVHWFNNIHLDDRARVEQALQQEQQGKNFNQEYRFIRPDGELRWLHSRAFPIQDETGNTIRIVGTVDDITDRKQAEEALRESEERFRRAFDDAPIGMSLVSATGQFLRANAFYCNMMGYSEAELFQMTFQEITHPNDLKADLEGVRQMMTGELRALEMEKRYITKQGQIIPAIMRTAPIRSEDGNILYFVGHIQDIRDRLKVERMKDEFISVISHELRTPLTSIRGALGILGSGIYRHRPEKAAHMLQIAISNSDRLVRLVNDILDLERLESGKVPLVMQPCQVSDLLQPAVDSVQPIADQANITLSWSALSETLWVAPDAIVQALTNLLSNAIKFSTPGNTVWLKAELGENRINERNGEAASQFSSNGVSPSPLPAPSIPYVLFSVQDQGRGIPADKLNIIFEQFQQVDISDSRKKGGTGLGLAICRSIVQQHGGTIWVESSLGQGSTFYFTLPLIRQGEP